MMKLAATAIIGGEMNLCSNDIGNKVNFAFGYRGQFCVVIPELKLTAAIISDMNDSIKPLAMLKDFIFIACQIPVYKTAK